MTRSARGPSAGVTPSRHAPSRHAVDPIMVGRARDLLERANLLFDNADGVDDDAERFRQYYLAALRAAGAALAVHEHPVAPVRRRSPNAWSRIAVVVPTLAAAADRFAGLSGIRMKIESGIMRTIDPDSVAGMRVLVIAFLDRVEEMVIAYEQGRLGLDTHAVGHSA